jgi:hypothetical protein
MQPFPRDPARASSEVRDRSHLFPQEELLAWDILHTMQGIMRERTGSVLHVLDFCKLAEEKEDQDMMMRLLEPWPSNDGITMEQWTECLVTKKQNEGPNALMAFLRAMQREVEWERVVQIGWRLFRHWRSRVGALSTHKYLSMKGKKLAREREKGIPAPRAPVHTGWRPQAQKSKSLVKTPNHPPRRRDSAGWLVGLESRIFGTETLQGWTGCKVFPDLRL